MKTSRGVSHYLAGKVETTTFFPNGDVACRWCELYLRYEPHYNRYSCRLTGEWILAPEHERGQRCPLVIQDHEHLKGD